MFTYNDIKIYYKYIDNKSDTTLVYLHGWGQNVSMMEPIAMPFSKNKNILLIDLPGHGKSNEPTYAWTLFEYTDMVHALIEKLKIENPILIGHSFGGKISIIYASKYNTNKLVLLSSPFKVAITKLSFKTKVLKKIAKVPCLSEIASKMKEKMGSTDYRNASPIMREVLVKHVNTDTSDLCKNIKCPTIIIWGTKDTTVSIDDAYELEKLIKDAAVISYDGGSHFAYLENKVQTINIIKSFIS